MVTRQNSEVIHTAQAEYNSICTELFEKVIQNKNTTGTTDINTDLLQESTPGK
jgi:hypothetical protein